MTGNRYFVCTLLRPPVEFDIANERPVDDAEIAYFIRGFQILEREYGLRGYTVCFAWGSRIKLPHIGPDVIAVIYGDEHCRVPPYVDRVAAVIKCHGLFPNFVPRRAPLRLAQIEAVEFIRNLWLWLPTGWRWLFSRRTRARCVIVPVGYGLTTEVRPPPFSERPYLASFVGSLASSSGGNWLRRLTGTPKAYSRGALLPVLKRLQAQYGEGTIPLRLTGGFQESIQDSGRNYFDILARSKLCIAPRGTAHETLRMLEGLRFGCVVIADRLPPHSFYRDSAIIQIDDWRDLPAVIESLLADQRKLHALHERSLRYWRDVLSEEALAARCAGLLRLERSRHDLAA